MCQTTLRFTGLVWACFLGFQRPSRGCLSGKGLSQGTLVVYIWPYRNFLGIERAYLDSVILYVQVVQRAGIWGAFEGPL